MERLKVGRLEDGKGGFDGLNHRVSTGSTTGFRRAQPPDEGAQAPELGGVE
ncbi:MAG TPA: hypothetical protein VFZ76_17270 [Anaerolineales bacterium]